MSHRRPTGPQLILLALVAAGAALRFATLGDQSFWIDEGYTVRLLRSDFAGLLHGIPRTEETPPLYYVLAWLWAPVFGTGEAGVRSLSALFGVATIPVAYLLARRLVSARAGVVAAALAAFSPLLVWYSQEARAYALLILLSGLSMLLFLKAQQDERRALGLWAVVSALALATHYFAVFVVVPEAAWLLARGRTRRRRTVAAVGAVGVVGAALVPLAVHQAGTRGAEFIRGTGLPFRIALLPKQYLVGYDSPWSTAFSVAAAAIAAAAVVLLLRRAGDRERRGAAVAALLFGAVVGAALVLALAGADYLITRNLIAGWLPFAVVLAAGLGAPRARLLGPLLATALCGLFVAAVIAVDARPEFQRDDWRGAARALGAADVPRAVVVSPLNGLVPLSVYRPGLRRFPASGYATVNEIDLLAVARRRPGQTPRPPRPQAPTVPGFENVTRIVRPTFTLIRMRARAPATFPLADLYGLRLEPYPGTADVLVQPVGR